MSQHFNVIAAVNHFAHRASQRRSDFAFRVLLISEWRNGPSNNGVAITWEVFILINAALGRQANSFDLATEIHTHHSMTGFVVSSNVIIRHRSMKPILGRSRSSAIT
jgi:hypothetical protein